MFLVALFTIVKELKQLKHPLIDEYINEMHYMVDELGIYYHDMLDLMTLRLEKPHVTYSQRLVKLIEKQGYINTIVDLSLKNKQKFKNTKIKEMKEYRKLALN